jgi:SAM-dependent methyltransferase
VYSSWAQFYDEVYVDQHDSGDLAFYLGEAKAAGGPVLEAACGTGRILLPTLAAGVDIDGFDREPAMLERLRRRGAWVTDLDRRVWQADLRDFTARRHYALLTCPFRAFLHLLTVPDQLAALGRFREHLLPGGRLLLNIFHPCYRFTVAQVGEWKLEDEFVHRATNRHTRYWCAVENDLVNQVKTIRGRFEELGEAGSVVQETLTEFQLTWIFKPQMELLLRSAGFSRWQIHGGFDRSPLVRDDQEMVVEAWA